MDHNTFHSVRLDAEKCRGCTHCIQRCPTQAIRVRNGKAHILSERCIDCGVCIRVCPHHAKYAERDSMNRILDFEYRIALPAPALYGQFSKLDDIDYVLNALKMLGFDDCFEVSRGAELISEATRALLEDGALKLPVISSACPAVCRLIRVRYPKLLPNLLPLIAPMEAAARIARKEAVEKTGLPPEKIGIFFLTPCPAKITEVKQPATLERSNIDGAIAIKDIYAVLLRQMNAITHPEPMAKSGLIGISWASSGGEASALLRDGYLAADGIENVMQVLSEIEDEKITRLSFAELNACTGGCVGGCLTGENAYIAKARIKLLRKYLPVSCNHLDADNTIDHLRWKRPLEPSDALKLADNIQDAMTMMNMINELLTRLPGLDCGTCGTPSCRALAEDVVRGTASENDCVFRLREGLDASEMQAYIPAPFRKAVETSQTE